MTGFHQRQIEALPGVAEDFGDDAPVTVGVVFADADLSGDDPAQIIAAFRSPRALVDLGGVDAVKTGLDLLPVASGAESVGATQIVSLALLLNRIRSLSLLLASLVQSFAVGLAIGIGRRRRLAAVG